MYKIRPKKCQDRMTLRQFQALKKAKKNSKYCAVRQQIDGFKFDSKAEASMYLDLKSDPNVQHIDIHPKVSLPGGVTLSVDFIVWRESGPEAIEVKGFETQDFKTKRKLFNQFHPLAPLQVLKKTRAGWESI